MSPNLSAPRRYGVNRQAAVWASAAFLALGGAVVLLSSWALDPTRRLNYLRESAFEYIGREEWRQAALQLGNIVQVAPNDADAWRELGLVQLRVASQEDGDRFLNDAVRSLRRSAELAPDDPRPHRWLLEIELRTGDAIEARTHLAKLAELAPEHPMISAAWDALPSAEIDASKALAAKMMQAGGAEKAADFCRSYFAANPSVSDPELARLFIESLTRLHAFGERDRFMDSLTKKHPASKRMRCLRAESALLDGDLGAAVGWASECFDGPMAATARGICAEACLRSAAKEPAEAAVHLNRALEHLQKLIEIAPHDGDVIAKASLVEGERLGRISEALSRTESALEAIAEPTAELLEAHGRMLAAAGRLTEAIPFLERAMTATPSERICRSFERAIWSSTTKSEFAREFARGPTASKLAGERVSLRND